MAEPRIDRAELRLLSGILALVLDDNHGQSGAALEALRRRARVHSVSGGALKQIFDRLAAETAEGATQDAAQRLRLELDTAAIHAARLAADNAELHHRLAIAEHRFHQLEDAVRSRQPPRGLPLYGAPPAQSYHASGLVAGLLLALLALTLAGDHASAHATAAAPCLCR